MKSKVLLAVLLSAFSAHAQSGLVSEVRALLENENPVVELEGEATHKVPADRMIVSAQVRGSGRSIADAMKELHAARSSLESALTLAGLASSNVAYRPFSFDTKSGFFSKKIRYSLESSMRITVADETQFARVLDVLNQRPDDWFFKSFDVEDTQAVKHRDAAAEKAMDEIERKKAFFERRLKVKLIPHEFEDIPEVTGAIHQMLRGGTAPSFRDPEPTKTVSSFATHTRTFGQVEYRVRLKVSYRVAVPK